MGDDTEPMRYAQTGPAAGQLSQAIEPAFSIKKYSLQKAFARPAKTTKIYNRQNAYNLTHRSKRK